MLTRGILTPKTHFRTLSNFPSTFNKPSLVKSMSSLNVVYTEQAPKAIGPYSQAIKANGLVFVSGQIPVDPSTGKVVEGIEQQTHQVLKNLKAVLVEANSGLDKVIKTNVFLKDMNTFQVMNKVYAEHFGEHKPARAAVEVSRLPLDVLVEIECVALAP